MSHEHALGVARQHLAELQHVARAEQVIDLGQLVRELVRMTLTQATGHDELLAAAFFLVACQIEDRVDRLLARRVDEAAGVDDDDLGVTRVVDVLVAFALGHPQHDLGVDPVLRTAEAHEMDGAHEGIRAVQPGFPCIERTKRSNR
jgi:hypothetical protein